MSRGFKDVEATTAADGFTYTCVFGDIGSTGVSIDVANDGVTVFAEAGGPAGDCLAGLAPKGLTFDQLKSMFVNEAAPLWSEISPDCPAAPVEIVLPDPTGGTYDFFKGTMFADGGEFRAEGPGVYIGPIGTDDPVLEMVADHPASVTFIGFPAFATAENKVGVAIEGVFPSIPSISAGEYSILGRQIFMRLPSVKAEKSVPFVTDGLTGPTPDGFVPLSDAQVTDMIGRLETLSAADECGPDGALYMGGSSTVSPLAEVWGETYEEECPNIDVVVATGGSSEGARLACGISTDLTADADIGMMSRGFKDVEATTAADGFTYTCVFGDIGSTGVSIDVANDGVTVFAEAGGPAGDCLAGLAPKGLTFDQLKSMFVNEAAPLWSEISPDCPAAPVEIVLPDPTGGTYDFFKGTMFADGGEFRAEGPGVYIGPIGTDDPVLEMVADHPASVTFIGFPAFATAENKVGVAIEGVFPSIPSISAGEYSILGRQIFMRLPSSKKDESYPFVVHGLTGPTPDGFVPLSDAQIADMLSRMV